MSDKSFKKWNNFSDTALLGTIGDFVQHHRVKQNKSQTTIAKEAGISRSTLSLLERGQKVKLETLIQVLRVLDLLNIMDVFQISQEISPIAYAKMQKNQRKKASPKSNNAEEPDLEW